MLIFLCAQLLNYLFTCCASPINKTPHIVLFLAGIILFLKLLGLFYSSSVDLIHAHGYHTSFFRLNSALGPLHVLLQHHGTRESQLPDKLGLSQINQVYLLRKIRFIARGVLSIFDRRGCAVFQGIVFAYFV